MPSMQVMVQTAGFVRQAAQMEFLLRVKQAHNKNFGFLMPDTKLHPFFRWLVDTNPSLAKVRVVLVEDQSFHTSIERR